MKMALSIDDHLLKAADEKAREMGLSRSRFFATAIANFLHRQHNEDMLRRLNEVYGEGPSTEEKRLARGMKARFRSTLKNSW